MLNKPGAHNAASKVGKTTFLGSKPTPVKQLCETNGSEIYHTEATPTTIQPPISSTKMINASRRKFISTPRNANNNNGGHSSTNQHNHAAILTQTLKLPASKSTQIHRQLSNKLLSPVATTSRTNKQPMNAISPRQGGA